MSTTWALTYFEVEVSETEFFEALVQVFRQYLDEKLYDLEETSAGEILTVNLGKAQAESLEDTKRKQIITDSLFLEYLNKGILLYPRYHGLYVVMDNIINLEIYSTPRLRREQVLKLQDSKPDVPSEVIWHYQYFLGHLTAKLKCQAAHVMYDKNPAGRGTSIHFYDKGVFVDDYYYENIEAIGTEIIELPHNRELVRQILGGRFAFLTKQPHLEEAFDGETYATYFDGSFLSPKTQPQDIFEMKDSNLYCPLWVENMLPIAAIYFANKAMPDYFLARYDKYE